MIQQMKKAIFAGIGMAALTKDKVEELAKKLVTESNLSEQEGRKLVDEIVKKSQETRATIEKTVHDAIDTALSKLHLPTKAEIAALEQRIKDLEDSH